MTTHPVPGPRSPDATYQEAFRQVAAKMPDLLSDQAKAHQATLDLLRDDAMDLDDDWEWTRFPNCTCKALHGPHADDCPRWVAIRAWRARTMPDVG